MERIHVFTSPNANSGFSNPPASIAPQKVESNVSFEELPDIRSPFYNSHDRRMRHFQKRRNLDRTEA
jgi:hypothetical protein